jgi:signal peptidase I
MLPPRALPIVPVVPMTAPYILALQATKDSLLPEALTRLRANSKRVVRFLRRRSVANLALQLVVLALLIAAFFVRMPQVSGLSMEPHIHSGEYVLINTFAYRLSGPRRGDIVAFRHDNDTRAIFIKRVVGLPGDRIRIDRGRVYIDRVKLDEPYVQHPDDRTFAQITVPASSVYVLGDNRADSEDSRFFGPVADDQLIGQAVAGIWPPRALGSL